jgi:hypothetical protein
MGPADYGPTTAARPAPALVRPQVAGGTIHFMAEVILAGVLAWLTIFVWLGIELLLRSKRRAKVLGTFLLAVAVIPSLVALWLGT